MFILHGESYCPTKSDPLLLFVPSPFRLVVNNLSASGCHYVRGDGGSIDRCSQVTGASTLCLCLFSKRERICDESSLMKSCVAFIGYHHAKMFDGDQQRDEQVEGRRCAKRRCPQRWWYVTCARHILPVLWSFPSHRFVERAIAR